MSQLEVAPICLHDSDIEVDTESERTETERGSFAEEEVEGSLQLAT